MSKYRKICTWTYNEDYGYYDTHCENTFHFITGDLSDNPNFIHCPYCGNKIKTKKIKEQPLDEGYKDYFSTDYM